MANFSLDDVKALRERLGTGMVDTKNALVEADGGRRGVQALPPGPDRPGQTAGKAISAFQRFSPCTARS